MHTEAALESVSTGQYVDAADQNASAPIWMNVKLLNCSIYLCVNIKNVLYIFFL